MLAFTRVALVRLVRDRTNVFFVVLFPLLIVLLIGLQFSGTGAPRIGITPGADTAALTAALLADDADLEVVEVADAAAARAGVEAGELDAAVLVPTSAAPTADVAFLANPGGGDAAVRSLVEAAVATVDGPRRAARALVSAGVVATVDDGQAAVDRVGAVGPDVTTTMVGEAGVTAEFAGLGQFDLGASSQLLLFVFITATTGSAGVVQARRWRVLDRVLAGPTAPGTVVAGLGLGQLAVAGVQAVVIVAATTALFGVSWGDPLASGVVVVAFALVAAAAGLLLGALLRNEEQVGGVAVPLSLGLAAVGGSMMPLELFPPTLRSLALLTPHAWGNLAFAEIVRRDGTVLDVLPHIGVLVGYAAVLGTVATLLLRRRLAIAS